MNTPHLDALVSRARTRMRVNRALRIAARAVLAAATAAVVWLAVARAVLLPDVEQWIVLGLAVATLIAIAVAAAVRIRPVWAAWAADRWLQTKDRFSTAVEFAELDPGEGSLLRRQILAAEEAAGGIRRFPQGPVVPIRQFGIGVAVIVLAATLGVLPNPQDVVRERLAAQQAAVEAEAQALEEAAEQIEAQQPTPAREEAAEDLRRLAEQLREGSLEEALDRLAEQRADVAQQLTRDAAAQRTALAGLARELGARPLGEGDTVRQQLDDLARQMKSGELTAEELEAARQRLAELSESLAAGAPGVSSAMAEAAAAAAAGDQGAAGDALAEASAAVGDALAQADAQDALSQADGALASAESNLRAAGQG